MSLVYAKKLSNSEMFFIADTKFTFPESETNLDKKYSGADEFIGGLKLIVLHGGLTVAFAGITSFAKDAIEGIYKKKTLTFGIQET